MKKLFTFLLVTTTLTSFGQDTLFYNDFHLQGLPAFPVQRFVFLHTSFVNVDTANFINYNLTSTEPCVPASMNTLTYRTLTPTTAFGDSASNIFTPFLFYPSHSLYISNANGVYYNGYDFSYCQSCMSGCIPYIGYKWEYSDPEMITNYPIYKGNVFNDSAYYTYNENIGGCVDPYALNTSRTGTSAYSISGKVINIGSLTTPCENYDTVFFIRRILLADKINQVHKIGMDSAFNFVDTTWTERFKVKTTNITGVTKNHNYILFNQSITETNKYLPDSTYTIDTFSLYFYKNLSAGVEAINNDIKTSVFPNPTTTVLNISTNSKEQLEITLYDLSSRKILQQTFTNTTTLNTEQLAKGMYFYEVSCFDKLSRTSRIIKNGKVIKE